MRVVVAGDDEAALRLAEELMGSHEVTFLGPPSAASSRLDRLDIDARFGAVTSLELLRQAEVDKARVFIATTTNDEQNIVACLLAQRLGVPRTFCFLNRPGFFAVDADDAALAESLGITHVVRPPEQLAEEIVRIVTTPDALDVQHFAEGRVSLLKTDVEEGAPLTRGPLKNLTIPKGVVLVMGRRGGEMFIPRGDTHFQAGDHVTIMGHRAGLRRFSARYLHVRHAHGNARQVTIIGGGTVGQTVARELVAQGWDVIVIEADQRRCEEVAENVRCLVLAGDGSDLELLEQEFVGERPVLVAVTNNDEKNLLVSLLAKHLGVHRIITRADRLANERMFDKVGVDVVLSARGAAVRSVVRELLEDTHAERLAELEHGDVRVLEIELPADFPRRQLAELRAPLFAIVGAIKRNDRVLIPTGHTVLEPRDHILVFCTQVDEARTLEFFRDPDAFLERASQRS